jgi:hypothetical protein
MSLPARKNFGGCYQSALMLFGVILFLSAAVEGAEWAAGSNAANQTGIYGAKGVASTENVPGARRESASWVDAAGNFWLFGGWNGVGYLNDLWKFDGTNWTWMSGSMYTGQTGVYGTPGSAASENIPGARGAAVGWVDRNGNFWLFGGAGYAPGGTWAVLDDLWKFDGTNWTLVNGSTSVARQAGVYGTLGVAAAENMPGARYGGVSWADRAGNLWLFGGWGYDSLRNAGWLNDLWKFDGTYWTWVSGAISPALMERRAKAHPRIRQARGGAVFHGLTVKAICGFSAAWATGV